MIHSPELDIVTKEMLSYAGSLGIRGTAVAYFVSLDFSRDVSMDPKITSNRVFRPRDPARDTETKKDAGTNYVDMATGKAGRRLRLELGEDITAEPHSGEPEARGDVALNLGSIMLILAFSGGTEDQDVQISQYGLDIYCDRYMS